MPACNWQKHYVTSYNNMILLMHLCCTWQPLWGVTGFIPRRPTMYANPLSRMLIGQLSLADHRLVFDAVAFLLTQAEDRQHPAPISLIHLIRTYPWLAWL